MKLFSRILFGFLILLTALLFTVYFTGNGFLIKGLWASYLHGYKTASISDARFFKTRDIAIGNDKQAWSLKPNYNKAPLSPALKSSLESTQSVAFLVIQNDSLLLEHYWDNYSDSSLSNSFSMAKSITTMLAQIAIQKGVLLSWNQKVKTLLPNLKGQYADDLELWHLSTMSSGLVWDEKYTNPFSVTAKAYYGADVEQLMMQLPISSPPGKVYNYQSGSTQLLGMCISAAAKKPLATVASEWLWVPLQAEHAAKWHTDDKGTDLAYCCFNSNARDFARFGKLLLHHGKWNNQTIIDSAFLHKAIAPALAPYYGYSFWLDDTHNTPIYYMRGILGQYVVVIPEYNTVVVRLGHQRVTPKPGDIHTLDYTVMIDEVLKVVKGKY